MRTGWIIGLIILSSFGSMAYAEEAVSLKTQREKISYIIGLDAGKNLKVQSIDVDPDIFMKGFKDGLGGHKSVLSDEIINESTAVFRDEMMKKHEAELKKAAEQNKKDGEAFLAENKKKEGVKTLPSGLQYKVLKEGTGKSPKAADTVV